MSRAAGMAIAATAASSSPWADVEAERHRADHHLGRQRDAEPHAADGDEQVGGPAGQPEGAGGAVREQRAEAEADGQQPVGRVGAGGGDGGDRAREAEADRGEDDDAGGERALEDQQRADALGAAQRREGGEREEGGADRDRQARRRGR